MSEIEFKLTAVEDKPSRKYIKRSKYDPIIDKLLELDEDLVKVHVEDKEANYLRTQIKKRIDRRGLEEKVDASVINGVCYMEKKE
ncbi:MAG: hypothetical protein ACLFVP_07315 [Candidatus Bathyarchaeia archaeon]